MCKKCDPCTEQSVLKPDIVFFGESLPEHFHERMKEDKDQCDLLIVIGSSLKVRPVALVPSKCLYVSRVTLVPTKCLSVSWIDAVDELYHVYL